MCADLCGVLAAICLAIRMASCSQIPSVIRPTSRHRHGAEYPAEPLVDLADGHHAFDHGAVLGAVNALRWRFDRAFRAAFGH